MAIFPKAPFASDPKGFQTDGGGIDYLGLRWVSLTLLTEELLPGINNQTRDFGVYCLATWIPWKFRKRCQDPSDFTLERFRSFEEAIGVAISYSLRAGSDSLEQIGEPNAKIGVQQKLTLPSVLGFKAVERTRATSIFAAPLYGPSLKFLDFIAGNARAVDGTATEIPMTAENEAAESLARCVDRQLKESKYFESLLTAAKEQVSAAALEDLSQHGLNPAAYRNADDETIVCFLEQLVPPDDKNGRTKTARLLIETLRQSKELTLEEVRSVWHTGRFADGTRLRVDDSVLADHLVKWSVFQARQYQRYIIELMMRAFEKRLRHSHSITEIVNEELAETDFAGGTSFDDILNQESSAVTDVTEDDPRSAFWNEVVHGDHASYEWNIGDEENEMGDCERALRMLARWVLRTESWLNDEARASLMSLGGEDRIGMSWFLSWIEKRRHRPLTDFVNDWIEQLIFGQHVRVALSRFDGKSQKLRFLLDDQGIVLAKGTADDPGKSLPGWTQDRLDAFVDLLCDVDVLVWTEDNRLGLGRRSACVSMP
jgi:hypothetical protein